MKIRWLSWLIVPGMMSGCAALTPPDYAPVATSLRQSLPGLDTHDLSPELSEAEERQTEALLAKPLTPDSVMQITLLKNRALRARLADIGIANADLNQAALIHNPEFFVGGLRPEGGGRWQLDFGLSQSLADLLTRRLRRQLAEADFKRVQWQVIEAVQAQLLASRRAYFEAVAAHHRALLLRLSANTAQASADLAQRFRDAGNISELETLVASSEALREQLAAEKMTREAEQADLTLADAIGLGDATGLKIPERLPAISEAAFAVDGLLARALSQRADLARLTSEAEQATQALALAEKRAGVTDIQLGLKGERDYDGSLNAGPELSISVPVFDQGQARIAAAQSRCQQIELERQSLLHRIDNAIRRHLGELELARVQSEALEKRLIPQQRRILALTQRQYNFMLSGAFELLRVRQQAYQLERDDVDALADYWLARTALESTIGGSLAIPVSVSPVEAEASGRHADGAQEDAHDMSGHDMSGHDMSGHDMSHQNQPETTAKSLEKKP